LNVIEISRNRACALLRDAAGDLGANVLRLNREEDAKLGIGRHRKFQIAKRGRSKLIRCRRPRP